MFVFSAAAATSCVVLVLLLDAAIDDDGNDFDEEVDEVDEVDEEDAEDAENEDGDADEDAEDTATATASQAGIFGLTARLPYQYTQAVVGGQGAAGATVSLLSLLSLLSQDCSNEKETAATATATATPTLNAIKTQSFAYFFSSAVVVLICLGIFVWLTKTEFVKQTINGEGGNSNILSTPALPQSNTLSSNDDTTSDWFVLVRILWRHCLGVCFTFMITLAIFPGLTADIQSYNNPYDETCPATGIIYGFGVWQSFLFLLFNVGDTFGRQLTLLGSVIKPKNVWILARLKAKYKATVFTLIFHHMSEL